MAYQNHNTENVAHKSDKQHKSKQQNTKNVTPGRNFDHLPASSINLFWIKDLQNKFKPDSDIEAKVLSAADVTGEAYNKEEGCLYLKIRGNTYILFSPNFLSYDKSKSYLLFDRQMPHEQLIGDIEHLRFCLTDKDNKLDDIFFVFLIQWYYANNDRCDWERYMVQDDKYKTILEQAKLISWINDEALVEDSEISQLFEFPKAYAIIKNGLIKDPNDCMAINGAIMIGIYNPINTADKAINFE